MTSLNHYPGKNAGFTLVEIVVSIGILALLAGLGLFLSMDFYRGYAFNYEENLVVSLLQKARSQAMANIGQLNHGVCMVGTNYSLFEGNSCVSGNTFPKSASMTVTFPAPVVFNQLDGSLCTVAPCSSTVPKIVTISGQGRTANITINNEGQIDW